MEVARAALQELSDRMALIIVVLGAVHFCVYIWLWIQRRRAVRRLVDFLENIVRTLPGRTDYHGDRDVDDQILCFIEDVGDVLRDPSRSQAREELRERLLTKNEERPYIERKGLQRGYSIARTFIETYTLWGILGTVLAIAVSFMGQNVVTAAVTTSADSGAGITSAERIVMNFGNAVWATVAGVVFAAVFMLLNAAVEPDFERLFSHQTRVRETIATARRELGLAAAAGVT